MPLVVGAEGRPEISLVLRGTTSWHDVMTDLVAHAEPVPGGYAHRFELFFVFVCLWEACFCVFHSLQH